MRLEALQSFTLVGGTNMSLRFGHRVSEDLDIFANEPFDSEDIVRPLLEVFSGEITIVDQRAHTLLAYIHTIKVDIVLHRYPYLEPFETFNGVRMASVPDIVAMKLNAITRRSTKKDFFDISTWTELIDKIHFGFLRQSFVIFFNRSAAMLSKNALTCHKIPAFILSINSVQVLRK